MAHSISTVLQKFSLRQSMKGAIVIAFIAFAMVAVQAAGYIEAYPDKKAQVEFAASLKSVPSLGVMYGSPDNLDAGTSGYIAYRVVTFVSLIISVWAFLTVTKRLRGNEEDGRMEVLRLGTAGARSTTLNIFVGFMYAYIISFILACISIALLSTNNALNLDTGTAILMVTAMYLPGLVTANLGLLASQLSVTRRRAVLYGMAVIAVFYILRVIGTIVTSDAWILQLTPYGWTQLINPVLDPQLWWILPSVVVSIVLAFSSLLLTKRDLGEGAIGEKTAVTPRYWLLSSLWGQALRQNSGLYISWCGIVLVVILVIVGVSGAIDERTTGSINGAIQTLGQAQNIKTAFLGSGIVFLVMVWLLFTTIIVGSFRRDEARSYLDAILVGPHSRTSWLLARLLLGIVLLFATGVISAVIVIIGASSAGLGLDSGRIFAVTLAALSTSVWLLGFGALIYSILPRLAVIIMYFVVGISFVIDMVSAVMTLDPWLQQLSLFHYVSFNLNTWPNWTHFWWLIVTAIVMIIAACFLFKKRDITTE